MFPKFNIEHILSNLFHFLRYRVFWLHTKNVEISIMSTISHFLIKIQDTRYLLSWNFAIFVTIGNQIQNTKRVTAYHIMAILVAHSLANRGHYVSFPWNRVHYDNHLHNYEASSHHLLNLFSRRFVRLVALSWLRFKCCILLNMV